MGNRGNHKQFFLFVHKAGENRIYGKGDLQSIRKLKHNLKTNDYFKGAYISPIWDSSRKPPVFITGKVRIL